MSKYRLRPTIKVEGSVISGYEDILKYIKETGNKKMIFEFYPGVDVKDVLENIINKLNVEHVFNTDDALIKNLDDVIKTDLTDDRIFTKFTTKSYDDFFDESKMNEIIKGHISSESSVVCGSNAFRAITDDSLVIYFDMPRWEIQLRYRNNEKVFLGNQVSDDKLQNFKRGYFIDWRIADKAKELISKKINLFIDTTIKAKPVLITKEQFELSLDTAASNPFRLVPYFDAGVWGGKWMEEKFGLGENEFSKWAWSFDGVPEENSLLFDFNGIEFAMPAMNLVLLRSEKLLGNKVINKFGKEFPIRFDWLDTMDGQNLSLQIHPSDEYAKEHFGLSYSQNESYYFMEVDPNNDVYCYLGVKNGTTSAEFIGALEEAQHTGKFDDSKYVNKFKVKKHDHLLHPSGVVHSSGSGGVVLEISSTPYIFTFKLWDWSRVGLDGKPRPINIERAKSQIDYTADEDFAKEQLVNAFVDIHNDEDYLEEKTGLHEKQFIETRRFTFKNSNVITIDNHGSVNMLNLIEGDVVTIESPDNSFEPFEITYAETFVVPASIKTYNIRRHSNDITMILQAFVR